MDKKKNELKKTENSSTLKDTEKKLNNNVEEFAIPNEGACSPEFAEGCIIIEDHDD